MDTNDSRLYARSFADVYDRWYGDLDDPAHLVAAMQRRCKPAATIVELGSGTGRLASPLHDAGFRVIAVDISAKMLHAAPDGPLPIAADMTRLPLTAQFADAALIAYNTLFNLADRQLQQRCFEEAARVLQPGGVLAVEAFIAPSSDATEFGISTRPHPTDSSATLSIVTGPHATIDDVIVGSHIEVGHQIICRPWQLTYQSPAELDATARAAGFSLAARVADWSDALLDEDAARHVSWYECRRSDLR